MASNNDTLYIKANRNVEVKNLDVTLKDVLEMECANQNIINKLNTLKLFKFHHTNQKEQNRIAFSILKVIERIHSEYPNLIIENMGETDFIITYEEQKTKGGVIYFLKVICVVIISFVGAAFSIMAFNNDVDTTKMFAQIYLLLTGKESNGFTILELTYCIGLTIGILTFFNHFGKKKFTVDPTPMEVEMRLYENDIQTTLIETYSRKGKERNVGNADITDSYRT